MRNNKKFSQLFESFKKRRDILINPNKKFCPFPNCESFLTNKLTSYITRCEFNHSFCSNCLQNHIELLCEEEEYGKDFQLWKEGKIIKRCPRCKFYNEKKKGINYLKCSECKYKWCFICNGEYTEDHYRAGKCLEITVTKPKINNCCSCCCISECENTDWNREFINKYILLSIWWFIGFALSECVGLPFFLTFYIVTEYAYFEDFSDTLSYYCSVAYVLIFGATSVCIGLLFQGLFSCVISVIFCVSFVVPCFNPFYLVWLYLRKEQKAKE